MRMVVPTLQGKIRMKLHVLRRSAPLLCLLLAACAAKTPRPVDPNAQVPPPNHPAPVKSQVSP
jgi:hypothetical protein